jgi:PHD/YefM family antitoxin component YafN of YafNO toxin-antitoxin module
MEIRELQAQYITDSNGKKTAVILPIEEFEELLEDLEDLAVLAERREEPAIPHSDVVEKLQSTAKISKLKT